MMQHQITFQPDDYLFAEQEIRRNMLSRGRVRMAALSTNVLGWCLVGMAVSGAFSSGVLTRNGTVQWIFGLLVAGLAVILVGNAFVNGSIRSKFTNNSRYFELEHKFRITENGIDQSGDGSSFRIDWKNIVRVTEAEKNILFWLSDGYAMFLPKRVTGGPAEVKAIVDFSERLVREQTLRN